MQLIRLQYFLSWGIISFYLEFNVIVPGQHFYGPANHFFIFEVYNKKLWFDV